MTCPRGREARSSDAILPNKYSTNRLQGQQLHVGGGWPDSSMVATPSTSPIEPAWGQGPGLDGVPYQGKPASCGWVGLGDLVTLYPRVTKHQKTDEQVIQWQPMRLAHGQRAMAVPDGEDADLSHRSETISWFKRSLTNRPKHNKLRVRGRVRYPEVCVHGLDIRVMRSLLC